MTAISKVRVYPYTREYRERYAKDGEWSDWISMGNGNLTATDTRSDPGPVPDFKQRIASHVSATTVLTGTKHTIRINNGSSAHVVRMLSLNPDNYVETEIRGNFGFIGQGLDGPSDFFMSDVKAATIMKMVSKIRSANTSLQGLVSAGELGESLRLLNSGGKNLRRGFTDYLNDITRIARRSSPRHLMSTVGQRWLEWSFGWKPIISDIEDAASAVSAIVRGTDPRILVRSGTTSSQNVTTTLDTYTIPGYDLDVTSMRRYTYGCKMYGCVSVTLNPYLAAAHQFGFELDEFIPTVWELIPYSFLADYFVNLGAIVSAYAVNTSNVKWMNFGELRRADLLAVIDPRFFSVPGWDYPTRTISLGAPFQYRWDEVSRGPYLGDYVPPLVFKIPGCGTQWLNIAALGAQHLSTSRVIRQALRGPYTD